MIGILEFCKTTLEGNEMGQSFVEKSFGEQAKNFEQFFEAQLSAIGLADDQLKKQSVHELRDSLEALNDAIRNPDSFGTLHLRMDGKVGLIVTTIGAQSHIQIGVLPLLLKKKKFLLERLRALEVSESVSHLKEELTEERDTNKQKSLEEKILHMEDQIKVSLERSESYSRADITHSLEAAAKKAAIADESFERKAKVWQELLARESVATLIGAALVFLITATLLFSKTEAPSVITNAYLVIIGFFFGQTMRPNNKNSNKVTTTDSSENP